MGSPAKLKHRCKIHRHKVFLPRLPEPIRPARSGIMACLLGRLPGAAFKLTAWPRAGNLE